MRKIMCLIAAGLLSFFYGQAQTGKNQLPPRPPEQKEISADLHLEKEIQRKQLQAKPVQLIEPTASKTITRMKPLKSKRKCKNVKDSL